MALLQFYDTRVEYNGEELGIYKPRNKSHAARMLPEYATCDVFVFEQLSRTVPKEQFIEELKELLQLAIQQTSGNVCFSPILIPTNFDYKRQSLANTKHFVAKILEALSGK